MFTSKKKIIKKEKSYLLNIAALLIHMAKIDENFTNIEERIIEKYLLELGANKQDLSSLIEDSKKIEKESNQILDFTREIKKMNEAEKINIIETLWRIIFSNKDGSYSLVVPIISKVMCSPTFIIKIIQFYNFLPFLKFFSFLQTKDSLALPSLKQ